jgi:hypothetical protein
MTQTYNSVMGTFVTSNLDHTLKHFIAMESRQEQPSTFSALPLEFILQSIILKFNCICKNETSGAIR